jgi:hypothetical protein
VQSNVPVAEATRDEMVLPDRVQDALGSWSGLRGRGAASAHCDRGARRADGAVRGRGDRARGAKGDVEPGPDCGPSWP